MCLWLWFHIELFTMLFITKICAYDFCETLLVKRTHTLLRYDMKFPFHITIFLRWLYDGSVLTHLWALKTTNKKGQRREGRCPWAPAEAYAPRTLWPSVIGKRAPCQLFLLYILPQSARYWPCPCNMHFINTHFDMFLNKVAWMVALWFFVCVRKHESKLPTNALTRVGKETWCLR